MIEFLVIYALSVYWLFHVLTRSDMLQHPRTWVLSHCPKWVRYISQCSFCFTVHLGLLWTAIQLFVTGLLFLNPIQLLAAPVLNMVLDLMVRTMVRANDPPEAIGHVPIKSCPFID